MKQRKPDILSVRSAIVAAADLILYAGKELRYNGKTARQRVDGSIMISMAYDVRMLCPKPPKPKVKIPA